MTVAKLVVRLGKLSGIEEDACINVWHVESGAHEFSTEGEKAAVTAPLIAFYSALGTYMHRSIDRSGLGCTIDLRTMNEEGKTPGPIHIVPFSMQAANANDTGLPAEVATCLSFRGDYGTAPEEQGTARPRSRMRGRVYIGPLATNALVAEAVTLRTRLAYAYQQLLIDQYTVLRDDWLDDETEHVVFSPTGIGAGLGVDAACFKVKTAWVDDAFDIIRSRGEAASSRTTVNYPD